MLPLLVIAVFTAASNGQRAGVAVDVADLQGPHDLLQKYNKTIDATDLEDPHELLKKYNETITKSETYLDQTISCYNDLVAYYLTTANPVDGPEREKNCELGKSDAASELGKAREIEMARYFPRERLSKAGIPDVLADPNTAQNAAIQSRYSELNKFPERLVEAKKRLSEAASAKDKQDDELHRYSSVMNTLGHEIPVLTNCYNNYLSNLPPQALSHPESYGACEVHDINATSLLAEAKDVAREMSSYNKERLISKHLADVLDDRPTQQGKYTQDLQTRLQALDELRKKAVALKEAADKVRPYSNQVKDFTADDHQATDCYKKLRVNLNLLEDDNAKSFKACNKLYVQARSKLDESRKTADEYGLTSDELLRFDLPDSRNGSNTSRNSKTNELVKDIDYLERNKTIDSTLRDLFDNITTIFTQVGINTEIVGILSSLDKFALLGPKKEVVDDETALKGIKTSRDDVTAKIREDASSIADRVLDKIDQDTGDDRSGSVGS
ncbi:hypothetical protein MAJ_11295, partial [Metarhizium majus ARSEF 297]